MLSSRAGFANEFVGPVPAVAQGAYGQGCGLAAKRYTPYQGMDADLPFDYPVGARADSYPVALASRAAAMPPPLSASASYSRAPSQVKTFPSASYGPMPTAPAAVSFANAYPSVTRSPFVAADAGLDAGDLWATVDNQYNLDRQIYKYEDTVARPAPIPSAEPPVPEDDDNDVSGIPGYKSPYSGRRLKSPIIPDPRMSNPTAYLAHMSTFWQETCTGHPITTRKREKRLNTLLAMFEDLQAQHSRQSRGLGSAALGSFGSFFQTLLSPAYPASATPPLLPAGPVKDWIPITGRRKALLVGINYVGQKGQLRGCANDVNEMQGFLQRRGFTDLQVLIDDGTHSTAPPTRANILNALQWLVAGAAAGDSLFFHYSGHGGQQRDVSGDEWDGKDETIVPVDFQTAGMIIDDTLCDRLCAALPIGCRLTCVMDCCHSGTGLDLPYVKTAGHASLMTEYKDNRLRGDAVLYSGCRDDQTTADVVQGDKGFGALTHAFLTALRQSSNQTYNQLLEALRQQLQTQRHTQAPQLSLSRNLNLDALFTV